MIDAEIKETALDRVRTILSHRLEERITEQEALDEMVAEIEAAGFDVLGQVHHA